MLYLIHPIYLKCSIFCTQTPSLESSLCSYLVPKPWTLSSSPLQILGFYLNREPTFFASSPLPTNFYHLKKVEFEHRGLYSYSSIPGKLENEQAEPCVLCPCNLLDLLDSEAKSPVQGCTSPFSSYPHDKVSGGE